MDTSGRDTIRRAQSDGPAGRGPRACGGLGEASIESCKVSGPAARRHGAVNSLGTIDRPDQHRADELNGACPSRPAVAAAERSGPLGSSHSCQLIEEYEEVTINE